MEATLKADRIPDDTPITVTMTVGEARAYLEAVGPISTYDMIKLPYDRTVKEPPASAKAAGQVLYDLWCALDDIENLH